MKCIKPTHKSEILVLMINHRHCCYLFRWMKISILSELPCSKRPPDMHIPYKSLFFKRNYLIRLFYNFVIFHRSVKVVKIIH